MLDQAGAEAPAAPITEEARDDDRKKQLQSYTTIP